jgi:hypothetical protein
MTARVSILAPAAGDEQDRDEGRYPMLELLVIILILFFLFGGLRFSRR